MHLAEQSRAEQSSTIHASSSYYSRLSIQFGSAVQYMRAEQCSTTSECMSATVHRGFGSVHRHQFILYVERGRCRHIRFAVTFALYNLVHKKDSSVPLLCWLHWLALLRPWNFLALWWLPALPFLCTFFQLLECYTRPNFVHGIRKSS
jgi:hypothetical protein